MPGALGQRADRPEPQVLPAEHVVAREVVLGEHVGQQQRVGVGAVAGQEHQRVGAVELAQPLQPGASTCTSHARAVQGAQAAGEQVDRHRAHRRDQPVQVGADAACDLGLGQLQPRGQLGDLAAELRAGLDRLDDDRGTL